MQIHNFVGVQTPIYSKDGVCSLHKLEIVKTGVQKIGGKLSLAIKKHNVQTSDKLRLKINNYQSNPEQLESMIGEVRQFIEERVLDEMYALSVPNSAHTIDLNFLDMECYNKLYECLVKERNAITARTRRGPANFAILSAMSLTFLQGATIDGETVYERSRDECKSFIKHCGTIKFDDGANLELYINPYTKHHGILLGYKGQSETDAPIVYVPELVGMLELEPTGTLNVSVRDSIQTGFSDDTLSSAADYYSYIGINVT